MNSDQPDPSFDEEIQRAAAQWLSRIDRGLTGSEQDEYSKWMAADPRHRSALARHRWGWEELDRLAGLHTSPHAHLDPDLLAPKRLRRFPRSLLWMGPGLLAAAVATIMVSLSRPAPLSPTPRRSMPVAGYSLTAPCERRQLEDGSTADLNRGAVIEVAFSKDFRRIKLVRGEAKFTVAKNPLRPFVVEAGGVEVQAVGTVFDVTLLPSNVDVVVSEGTVKLKEPVHPYAETPLVHAGQEAFAVRGSSSVPDVQTLSEARLSERLAWQPTMLHFDDLPLGEIVSRFNAHNSVQLKIGDETLAQFRLSAAFRSDNVEGFVRLMVFDFGMRADHPTDKEIVLRRAD